MEVVKPFINHKSDLPQLEKDHERLVRQLEEVIHDDKSTHRIKILSKVADFRLSVYSSFVFKSVCDEYLNKRRLGKVTSQDAKLGTQKIDQSNEYNKIILEVDRSIQKWSQKAKHDVLESDAINQLKADIELMQSHFASILANANKEIRQLKDYRRVDQETISLQKMESAQQSELLEETTEMFNLTSKRFQQYKIDKETKTCKCHIESHNNNAYSKDANKSVHELTREIMRYKQEMILKQEDIIFKNQEMQRYKQETEEQTTRINKFKDELVQKELKIQKILDNIHSLEQEIKILKVKNEYVNKSSLYSRDLLDDLQIKLTHSQSNLESNESKLLYAEKELFWVQKVADYWVCITLIILIDVMQHAVISNY